MEATELAGKAALVTGAGKGIGKGIAARLARFGADVLIAEIDSDAGLAAAAELRGQGLSAHFLRTDVSQVEQMEAAVHACEAKFGGLDILVNNAVKVAEDLLLEEKTDAMLREQLAIGLWAPWWAMRAALPLMQRRGGGRIINFTSGDVRTGAWLHADYSMAKGGVEGLTRSAANEWARFDITVNAIAPVAASSAYAKLAQDRPGFHENQVRTIPLGRVGDPESDIGGTVCFLASDAGRYVTGTIVVVDGGISLSRTGARPARAFEWTESTPIPMDIPTDAKVAR